MMIIIYNEGATLIKDNFQEGRQNKINEKLKMIQRDIWKQKSNSDKLISSRFYWQPSAGRIIIRSQKPRPVVLISPICVTKDAVQCSRTLIFLKKKTKSRDNYSQDHDIIECSLEFVFPNNQQVLRYFVQSTKQKWLMTINWKNEFETNAFIHSNKIWIHNNIST